GPPKRNSIPSDSIEVREYDHLSQHTILQFTGLTTYIASKRTPMRSGGFVEADFYPHSDSVHHPVRQLIYKDGFKIAAANEYAAKLHFKGAIQSKDLDNMAKTYLPILYGTQVVTPHNIVKLELLKEHESNTTGSIDIRVNCNNVQP